MRRLFVDTSYLIALTNKKDILHFKAGELSKWVERLPQTWTHEGILLELGDWLAKRNRKLAVAMYKMIRSGKSNLKIIQLNSELIDKGFVLYEKYSDKTIGLTDCISFIVMTEAGITEALTSDHHFEQAGFKALLK